MTRKTKISEAEVMKPKTNFMQIRFGYSATYIFPHADGMKIMEAMKNAELLDENDYKNPKITPIQDDPKVSFISQANYIKYKMHHLIGVPVDLDTPDEAA